MDASTVGHGGAQARYLNRLTPVSIIVKATESGLEEGTRRLLADHFQLKPKEVKNGGDKPEESKENDETVVTDEKTLPLVTVSKLHLCRFP